MMKRFFLIAIAAILLLIILLAMPGRDSYKLSPEDVIEKIGEHEHILSAKQMKLLEESENLVIVDLDKREEYKGPSIPGAIHLPAGEMTTDNIHQVFSGSGTYVLYAREISTSCSIWVLLTQLGYEDILILESL